MSDNQKYYYMRLKENFFDSPELKTIESMRGGYKYSNILLKLYLLSLRDEGRLTFKQNIPYNAIMLSKLTGFSKIEIENALKIFLEFGLIEVLDTGTIYMTDIQNLIGKSSTEADRQRKYQARIESEKQSIACKISNKESNKISTPERELKRELEKREREYTPAHTSFSDSKPYLLLGKYQNVKLTREEVDVLDRDYPEWKLCMEKLSEYMEINGKAYSNHYATICKWYREDHEKDGQDQSSGSNISQAKKPQEEFPPGINSQEEFEALKARLRK